MRRFPPTSTPSPSPPASATPRRVTSYDVASLAGVSQSAVSRCFRTGASVSKDTLARVMQAAAALDYTPNAAARGLITRRSHLVALVIAGEPGSLLPELLSALAGQLARRGMRMVLFTVDQGANQALHDIWHYQLDGAIVAAALTAQQECEFARRRMPLVFYNHDSKLGATGAIVCDHAQAAYAMVERLAGAGQRRLAIIDGPADAPAVQARLAGACAAAEALGLGAPRQLCGQFSHDSGAHALRALLASPQGAPDALLCGNDALAVGCLEVAHCYGLAVPNALSVVSLDGDGEPLHGLCTQRQPVALMAQAAVDMLAGLIEGDGVPQQLRFAVTVIDGASARFSPGAARPGGRRSELMHAGAPAPGVLGAV